MPPIIMAEREQQLKSKDVVRNEGVIGNVASFAQLCTVVGILLHIWLTNVRKNVRT